MADLLTIETSRVRVSWTGPALAAGDESGVRIRSFRGVAEATSATASRSSGAVVTLPLAVPEEAILTLLVQSQTGAPVEVVHRDPSQTSGLVRADAGRVVHGRVLVRDAAGWSSFVIRVGGRPEVEVVWPVRPVKLAVEDVRVMREEIEAAWAGAAFAAWSAATDESVPGGDPSRPAWVALLREAVRRLRPALDAIARRPDVALVREARLQPGVRLRGDAASAAAIRKGRGRGDWHEVAGIPVREHVTGDVLRVSVDTASHRWIRARLDRATVALAAVRREESAHPHAEHGGRVALRADLGRLESALYDLRRVGPVGEVAGARRSGRAPLVLRKRPAYREAFEALRLLDAGLSVAEGEVETAWLGTARLYETWAALVFVQEAARAVGAESPASPFGLDIRGARVRVRRGRGATVRLAGPRGEIDVTYEPRFGRPPALLAQRPDLLLTFRQPGRPDRRAVLDAKYRRDDSPGYVRRHGAAGPPVDAIGDLHRYRDAIVGRDGGRLIERAAALFPLHAEAEFARSRLWQSHEAVGVGGIPLAPGDRTWLRQWLRDWMGAP